MNKREELILNIVQDVTFEFDSEGKYLGIWANDEALLVRPRSEMDGKKITDILPADQANFYIGMIQSVIESQQEVDISYSLETPKGETFFKGKIVPLNYGGESPSVLLTARDVTAQVKLQEAFDDQKLRLSSILKSTKSVAFECHVQITGEIDIPFISSEAFEIFGYSTDEVERNSAVILNLLDSDNDNPFSKFLVASSKKLFKGDWVGSFTNKKGKKKWVQVQLSPQNIDEGRVVINGLIIDVSKRREEEVEIEKKKAYVNHQLKLASLGELCAGIGHEMKNPLQIINSIFIRMEKDLVKSKIDRSRLEDFSSMGSEATRRILTIIEGLNVFSHESSTLMEPFNLNESVALTVKLIAEICRSKNIRLEFVSTEESCRIFGNRGQIDQVLMNLISNAIDALASNENGNIRVELANQKGMNLIKISDNGAGIPKDVENKVFDHFFTSKEVGKGTGIGLSIVNRIISDHNGRISFKSSPKGTTFSVELPEFAE